MCQKIDVKQLLDLSGLNCPLPLLKAKQALFTLLSGEVLKVIATDSGSQRDFRSFAKLSGNELIKEESNNGVYTFWLKKCQIKS